MLFLRSLSSAEIGDALGTSLASPCLPATGVRELRGLGGGVYLLPVPTRYVLVPCRVMGPGLQPNTRTTRLDSCSMRCRAAAISISVIPGAQNLSLGALRPQARRAGWRPRDVAPSANHVRLRSAAGSGLAATILRLAARHQPSDGGGGRDEFAVTVA